MKIVFNSIDEFVIEAENTADEVLLKQWLNKPIVNTLQTVANRDTNPVVALTYTIDNRERNLNHNEHKH